MKLTEFERRRGNALAVLAKEGDRRARDVLYLLLAPEMEGLMRWQWRRCKNAACSLEDLRQEGFVAFCEVLGRWREDDFFRTFFGLMRWLVRHRTAGWRAPAPSEAPDIDQFADVPSPQVTAVEAVRCLRGQERQIAEAHLLGGLSVPSAARRLGMSRRTAYRRWNSARERMRRWYLGLL